MSGTSNRGILRAPPFPRVSAAAPVPGADFNNAMAQIERAIATVNDNLQTTVAPGLVSSDGTVFESTVLLPGLSWTDGTLENTGVLTIGSLSGTVTIGPHLSNSGGSLDAVGFGTMSSFVAGKSLSGGTVTNGGTVDVTPITAGLVSSNGTILEATTLVGATWLSGTLTVTGGIGTITAGAGLTTTLGSTGGSLTSSGTLYDVTAFVANTGTVYTVLNGDQSKIITQSNTAASAYTLPQAGAAGSFLANWSAAFLNLNTGLMSVTPTTSTILGTTVLRLAKNQGMIVYDDGANYQAIMGSPLYTLTSGALAASIPDSTTTGGNARGSKAVDIQQYGNRTSATQVASGTQSTTVGNQNTASATFDTAVGAANTASGGNSTATGWSNTSSGSASTAVGSNNTANHASSQAVGSSNLAQGNSSTAVGNSNEADGISSTVIGVGNLAGNVSSTGSTAIGTNNFVNGTNAFIAGNRGTDRLNTGAHIAASDSLDGQQGRSQIERYNFLNKTTGATAVRLTTDGTAAGAFNQAAIGSFQSVSFTVEIIITDTTSTGKSVTYSLGQSLLERLNLVATTTLTLNAGGIVAGPSSAGYTLGAIPTITADTTNGGLNISYTPPAGNTATFYAIAYVRYVSLRYN